MKTVIPSKTNYDALINLWFRFNDAIKRRCSDCRFCEMAITDDQRRDIKYFCVVSAQNKKTMENAYYELPCGSFKFCGWLAKFRREKAWERFADDIDRSDKEEHNGTR